MDRDLGVLAMSRRDPHEMPMLCEYPTGRDLRPATLDELERSELSKHPPIGVFWSGGRLVYVEAPTSAQRLLIDELKRRCSDHTALVELAWWTAPWVRA